MTHRGPFQPLLFCVSVILLGHLSCPPLPASVTLYDSSLVGPKRSVGDHGCCSGALAGEQVWVNCLDGSYAHYFLYFNHS